MQENAYTMTRQTPPVPFAAAAASGQKPWDDFGPLPINLSVDEIRAMIREVMG